MCRCLCLVLAVGLAVTAVGCAFPDDAPSDGASSVPSPGLHSRTGPPPSPSPVPPATNTKKDMSARLGAEVWRFRQSVAAAFAAHSEVLETDAEMTSVTLAPDTSIEDAAALMAAVRAEVAADAAECVDSEHATCGAGWYLRWSLQGTEIRLTLPPVPPDYPADEVRALEVVDTVIGTATQVDVFRNLLPPGHLLVSVDRQAEGDLPSTLPDQLPPVSDDAQDSQITYWEDFTTSEGVRVSVRYEDGAVLDRDSLARVLAQVRGADWEDVLVSLSNSRAPRFTLSQRLDDADRLTAEASTPVLSVLDDCTVTSGVVLIPNHYADGIAAYTCTEELEVDTAPNRHGQNNPQLAATLLEAARQH